MGGGLMQLVAYGAQDAFLSGDPEATFFKAVYTRHTNFSVEPIQQTWNGAPDFGRTVTCNVNRNGDLITNVYVAVMLNEVRDVQTDWGYVNRLGHAMVDNVKIEIGGSKIDEQYGDWLNVWYELTHKSGQERGYDRMIGNVPELTNLSRDDKRAYQLYVPLQFWFNRNNGLALPLIALQYHDVRITLVFRKAMDCINWVGDSKSPPAKLPSMQDSYLLIDYVYLDAEERKRFAQATHEYLIEQLQFTGSESLSSNPKYRLNFNHPSKYLVWTPRLERYNSRQEWLAYSFNGNWVESNDRFAKVVYAASRLGVVVENDAAGVEVLAVDNTSGLATAVGDLFEPPHDTNSGVDDLLAKMEVKCVCQEVHGGAVSGNTTAALVNTAVIAKAAGPGVPLRLDDLLVNLLVTRNSLSMEDVSRTAAEFTGLFQGVTDMAKVSVVNYHNYGNFVDGSDNPVFSGKLQLNGHDRFQSRDGHYFNYVQPFQHFSNTPCDGVNVYSFALRPEEHQPTGSCNFSRIDNATLQLDLGLYNRPSTTYTSRYVGTGSLLNIYTVNYNVLRVLSGMAGLAYSN